MTLQQLKYVVTVAKTRTITNAVRELYISQPSLTNAIHELEKEMNIVIFQRTNKGIVLSREGEDFLGYARQVLEQAAILEDKYKGQGGGKNSFACLRSTIRLQSMRLWTSSRNMVRKNIITNEELEAYPYLSFEQGEHNSFYFSEEIFSVSERKKNIRVRDRATLFSWI